VTARRAGVVGVAGVAGMIGPGRSGLMGLGLTGIGREALRRLQAGATAAVPARRLRTPGHDLTAGLPLTTGRAALPGPVVTHCLPGPVAPAPEAARTRMGELADALEEP
jgi:hypothetical protein